ncbi:TPA: hypothetical protein L9333_000708 [Klebsiella pneumoniae]|nr:hypothetical protein [Klebsiella pneumoniae]HBR7417391.1 hypothetical protein [Klebsiella pneumoniae]
MTKSTITRDQLRALAVKKVESLKFAITQSAFTNIRRGLEEELQLAEFALAAMDGEPVAYTDEAELCFVNDMACMWTKGMGINEVPLYRHAQPAPVVMQSEPAIADCDPEVYEKGVSVCLVAIPKETAEVICQNITAATGCKVDWHYFGGRVHIKALRVTSQPAQISEPVLPLQDKDLQGVIDALEHPAGINAAGKQVVRHALVELQERRKVERDTEPYGFTDGDRRGMIYKPEHSDRLSEPVPVYRHAQPAPVVSAELLHTAASAIEDLLTTKGRMGAYVWFDLPFRLRSAANAQPAPVVPEIDRKAIADKVYGKCCRIPGATFYNAAEFAIDEVEACLAAMLQGGNSPVIPDSARDALEKALAAMEFMGDTLNNLDAVCTEDVELVAPAFDAVRSVLAAAPQEVKGE